MLTRSGRWLSASDVACFLLTNGHGTDMSRQDANDDDSSPESTADAPDESGDEQAIPEDSGADSESLDEIAEKPSRSQRSFGS